MKKFTVFFLLFLSLTTQPARAGELTPAEAQIAHYIDTQTEEQLSLLEKLVNINSGTTNLAGVTKIGEILRPQFEKLGFKTYWLAMPSSMNRAGTLVAKRLGHKGKRLLLIGHLDTVFPANSPFQQFVANKNTATGPGIVDDKGGDVVILYALKALAQAHALDDASITVILTGDEEDSGKPTSISRKPLIDAARESDLALDFEAAITADTATTGRRGISSWLLETGGNEAHSSQIFKNEVGDGAIFELARILNSMRIELGHEPYLSYNPGLILGGTLINHDKDKAEGRALGKENVVAKKAVAQGDLRFLTAEQRMKAEKKLSTIVEQHLPGTTASIRFQDGIPAMSPTVANEELLEQYSAVSSDLGYGSVKALDPGLRGAGDISHVASMVTGALAGLGPVGTGMHSVNETVELSSLPMQTKRAAVLIYRLIQ